MQTTACLPADRLRALLADELAAADEAAAAAHLSGCVHCQQAAEQLADDPAARALQAEYRRAGHEKSSLEALAELRERLHVLGWFTSDSGNGQAGASIDGGSTFAAKNGDTAGSTPAERATAAAAVTCVGKFQIIQPIGAGGFGVVYLARDQVLHRQVALKLARTSVLGDPDLKSRFLREAEALARLQHPHIIPVYEAGEHDGTCYLAVGYCDGPTLEQWLRTQGRPMTPRQAAQLALSLAQAVEHAHHSGVLHRDIKPSNILLDHPPATSQSPAPFPFVPKLTDFGLAKIAEHEGATTTVAGMLLGTPPYMAPEQAAGWSERIGNATDVYALGAVLYETLTGRPPIVGESNVDTLRRVLIDEPTPPNQLAAGIPDDLAAIALKCLDKSPTRRYRSAGDLAADLQRFLDGRPTIARPLSRSQKVLRWFGRNKAASVVAGLAVLVLLLAGGVVSFNRRLTRLQQEFDLKNAEEAYCSEIAFAQQRLKEGDVVQAAELLRRHLPAPGRPDLRGLEWHYLWALTTRESYAAQSPGSQLYQICLSPDGLTLAAGAADATLYLYDAKTLAQQAVLRTDHREINGVCYSPSGQWIATVGDDGRARIWNAKTLALVQDLAVHQGRAYQAAFYAGGARLATCGEEPVIRLWNTTTWKSDGVLAGHSLPVEALALSPDGSLLASVGDDKIGIVWDLASKEIRSVLDNHEHEGRVSCVAFSPDGAWIASGDQEKRIVLWRHEAARRRSAGKQFDGVQSVAFTRDGRLIAGDRAGTIRTFTLGRDFPEKAVEEALKRPDETWYAHTDKVWSLAVLPESGRFLSAGGDGQIRAWQTELPIVRRWPAQGDDFYGIGYSRDGSQFLVLREASGIHAWDGRTGLSRFTLSDREVKHWESMIVLPGRKQVVAASQAGQFVLWNWESLQRRQTWKQGDVPFQRLAYCPATDQLAAIAHDREDVLILDARSGKLIASLPATSCTDCALSPDGTRLAVDTLNRLAIFDLNSQRQFALSKGHTQNINAIAYSPDGKLIATASSDRTVRLWTEDGQPIAGSLGHAGEVMAVAFTPDGQTLVTGGERGRIKLFHVPTRRELIEIDTGMSKIRKLAVAPSNREIALLDDDWQLGLITLPKRPADD